MLYAEPGKVYHPEIFRHTEQFIFMEFLWILMNCMAFVSLILRQKLKRMQCTVKCWYKIRNRHMKPVTVSTKRLLDVTDDVSANIKPKVVSIQNPVCFNSVSL